MASFKYWVHFNQSFNQRSFATSHFEPFIHVSLLRMFDLMKVDITLHVEISGFSLLINSRHSLLSTSAMSQSPIHNPWIELKSSSYIFLLCYTLCTTIWKKRYIATLREKVNEVVIVQKWMILQIWVEERYATVLLI